MRWRWAVLAVLVAGGASSLAWEVRREHAELLPRATTAARATGCPGVEVRGQLLWVTVPDGDPVCSAAAVAAGRELGVTFDDLGRTQAGAVVRGRWGSAAAEHHGATWAYAFRVT